MGRTILSISAAPGWSAKGSDPDDGEEQFFTLVAWALVEKDGGEREIVGLVQRGANDDVAPGSFRFADEAINGFSGYSFQGLKTKIGQAAGLGWLPGSRGSDPSSRHDRATIGDCSGLADVRRAAVSVVLPTTTTTLRRSSLLRTELITAHDGRRRSTCSAATNDTNAAALKATPGMSHPIEKLLIEAKTSRITPTPAKKPRAARKSGADLTAR